MKNIMPYLDLGDDNAVDNAALSKGKMTPRKKSRHCGNIKKGLSKLRRAALKRGEVSSVNSQYGGEGHSSWWD